ncbi:MAG TPA: FHA domain-containing protein [Thermoleophilaceae bacterium]|nr:FHA domain-containing protein [Thermoleophilaceae bacterium]
MQTDPVAVALKFAFLIVLYLFLLWVARSSLRDMRRTGQYVEPATDAAPPPGARERRERSGPDLRAGVEPRLEVIAAMGHEPGTVFPLADGGATMGRSASSDIEVDDPFASSAHARIFPRGDFMFIEDMGSTNGTYLNGRQLRRPEQLKMADKIRIGDTEYRYQE